MKRNALWALALVFISSSLYAQQIIKLKGSRPPIICYAEDKPGIQSHIAPPDVFLKRLSNSGRTKSATIEVRYINFPMEARSAFATAVAIWESLISSPVTIHITAVWSNLPAGTLGAAGPSFWVSNFSGTPKYNIYYPGPLAEKLAQAELNSSNEADIVAQFNSSTNWYFQSSGTPAPGQYDFITVVLHEIGHGLGFTSTFDVRNGIGEYGQFTDGIPFAFDLVIENGAAQNLYQNFESPSTPLGTQLTSNNTFINNPSNATRSKLYAPEVFNDGSSISHLDATTFPQGSPNSLMRPFINANEVNHNPGSVTTNIFRDLGWVTTYIDHDHINDQENISQPIEIVADIATDGTDGYSFNTNEVYLNYALNGSGNFTQLQMTPTGNPDEFKASIPPPGNSAIIQYNIQLTDALDRILTNPGEYYEPRGIISQKGPETAFYSFRVGPDLDGPVVHHTPKAFVSYLDNELVIDVEIKESNGLSNVALEYIFNNGSPQSSNLTLIDANPDLFEGTTLYHYRQTISLSFGPLQDGDEIRYKITAQDNSANTNLTTSPETEYYLVPVQGLSPSRTYYVNDFNVVTDDFIGTDFTISQPTGFNNPAIHSAHPYGEAGANSELDLTYQLSIPIVISSGVAEMTFDEIVIVEPGEDGSEFGDADFYDYVVTEGSKDGGATWMALSDGYDSRINGSWLSAYNNGGSGDATLFRKQKINLLEKFVPGDEVVFRFRLHSDPFANGWGWAIDNLTIQVDDVPPLILHNHIDYITEESTTLSLPISASDDLHLSKLTFEYKLNNEQSVIENIEVDDSGVLANFEIDVSTLSVGDIVYYRFEALDSAGNTSTLPTLGYFNTPKIQFGGPVQVYTNTFNSVTTDFVGNFFETAQPGGFTTGGVHTPHPYLAGFGVNSKSDFTYTLKTKILINEENPYIKFDEVALIEDHESGAPFGTVSFKDYVIVEASNDHGLTWKELVEGYDAAAYDEWLNAYNANEVGSSSLFKTRLINMLDTDGLEPDDEIIIRFRLFSDQSTHGWGWVLDNLHIQDIVTSLEEDVSNRIRIYPNPVVGNDLIIDYGNHPLKSIMVLNGLGQPAAEFNLAENFSAGQIKIPLTNFANGMYFVRMNYTDKSVVRKVIIRR